MPCKPDATVGNNTLGKRSCHHASEITLHAAFGRRRQSLQQGFGIGGTRLPRDHVNREGHVNNAQTIVEQPPVADDNDIVREWTVGKRVAEFGADAGRLAGCDYEWFAEVHTGKRN